MKLRSVLKNKKAAGVFGIPFSVLFSILLIIFFIVAAFIAIRFFMNFQKNSQIGLFINDLQDEVDDSWNSQASEKRFEGNLPAGITHVCFLNLTVPENLADAVEKEVYEKVKFSGISYDINFVLWPLDKAGALKFERIEHVKLPEQNPYCLEVQNQKIDLLIKKDINEALPRVM
jgi:hypothetical protein